MNRKLNSSIREIRTLGCVGCRSEQPTGMPVGSDLIQLRT